MYEKIPEELKKLNQWVCWRGIPDENRQGKLRKIPINPLTGGQAQSNNSDTWTDFATAVEMSKNYSGIGFMFNGEGYFGVDLDGVDTDLAKFEKGENDGIVAEFVNSLQSYTEKSQSGKGIHIICKGKLPKSGRRKANVEMYESGRYFIMTGNSCSPFSALNDCTKAISELHNKYIGGAKEPQQCAIVSYQSPDISTERILEIAKKSKNGSEFERLMNGDITGYPSQSEADMAFCNMLSFWFAMDSEKIDSVFRSSGLMRPKWDRRQSGTTYGAITITKAIAGTTQVFSIQNERDNGYTISIGNKKDKKITEYSFDDMGNAQRVIDMFGEKIRYNHIDKSWLYYNEKQWVYDNTGAIFRIVDDCVKAMDGDGAYYLQKDEEDGTELFKAFNKHRKASRSHKSKESVVKELQHLKPILPKFLDKDKRLINAPNGFIDLKSGEIHEHNSKNFFTKMLKVEYTEKVDCPLWLKFLDETFQHDKELINYIQKAIGYSLTGSTQEQCVFFLYGTGRNGKSTFLEIIRDIMGDYATNIQAETIMVKGKNTGANSDIARLKGARFVTSSEPGEGMRINEGLLKQLTGDDVVTARKLYGNEFEFKPEFKLWVATNHKPIIRGTDTGIWRRIHLIPFTVQISEDKVDKDLKVKLRTELPAILKWCVEGCLKWQNEGLKMPSAIEQAVKEYRKEMDVISSFVESECEVGTELYVSANEVYTAYCRWCDENNEYRMSNTKFGVEFGKQFEKVRITKGYVYLGVQLTYKNAITFNG